VGHLKDDPEVARGLATYYRNRCGGGGGPANSMLRQLNALDHLVHRFAHVEQLWVAHLAHLKEMRAAAAATTTAATLDTAVSSAGARTVAK